MCTSDKRKQVIERQSACITNQPPHSCCSRRAPSLMLLRPILELRRLPRFSVSSADSLRLPLSLLSSRVSSPLDQPPKQMQTPFLTQSCHSIDCLLLLLLFLSFALGMHSFDCFSLSLFLIFCSGAGKQGRRTIKRWR